MGQNDTIGKIELNPSFVLSSDNTREGAATVGNSAQVGSGGPNPKMTLLLVFNIFRNSTFYTNVDYVPSFILCNLVVGGSTGILAASRPF